MRARAALTAAVAAVLLPVAVVAQDVDEVEIIASHVGGSVWALEGRGGNIGVSIGPDGVLLVDDQFAPLGEKIHGAVDELGGGELRFVLNTHYHGDHTGGNVYFGRHAPIVAHRHVRDRLDVVQQVRGRATEPLEGDALPVVTYDDGLSLHFNGEEVRVIHMPRAHTDGDSIVWFTGSNVVHLGDLLFYRHFPFVDLDHGGSVQGLVDALRWVVDHVPEDARFIAGHFGPVVSHEEVAEELDAIVDSVSVVRRRMAAGADLEQLQAQGLPERFTDRSWRFIPTADWIETVYRSYAGAAGAAGPAEIEVPEHIRRAVVDPDRPAEDRERDADRRPGELLTTIGIEPGMRVADLMAGRGYYTEILAGVVGPEGTVVCQNSPYVVERFADGPLSERLARIDAPQVVRHDAALDELGLEPETLDAALMILFYHDTYWQGVDRRAMNRQIYEALVPGGLYAVVDHHAEAGSGSRDVRTLHRVDARLVESEILAAGFEIEGRSELLRNPEDDRTENVFEAGTRGKTDRFILLFRKPTDG